MASITIVDFASVPSISQLTCPCPSIDPVSGEVTKHTNIGKPYDKYPVSFLHLGRMLYKVKDGDPDNLVIDVGINGFVTWHGHCEICGKVFLALKYCDAIKGQCRCLECELSRVRHNKPLLDPMSEKIWPRSFLRARAGLPIDGMLPEHLEDRLRKYAERNDLPYYPPPDAFRLDFKETLFKSVGEGVKA